MMLRALAAELSDLGRFRRAKEYARDGAVLDIEVEPGVVRVSVQGSRYDPYDVELAVAAVDAAELADTKDLVATAILIPERGDLRSRCSCPDDDPTNFCKHALAGLLTLADEVTIEPGLLRTWRAVDADDRPAHVETGDAPADASIRASTRGEQSAPPGRRADPLAGWLSARGAMPPLGPIPELRLRLPGPLDDPLRRIFDDAMDAMTGRR